MNPSSNRPAAVTYRVGATRIPFTKAARKNTPSPTTADSRFAVQADAWHRTGTLCAQMMGTANVNAGARAQRSWQKRARAAYVAG